MSKFPIPEDLRASHWSWGEAINDAMREALEEALNGKIGPRDDKRKLAAALRNNGELKYLAFWTGYTTQYLLDSISTITTLERLAFGHLRAPDISGLANLKSLEYLSITSLSSANTLKPLTKLEHLVSLSLGISSKITSLEDFSENSMRSLRALHLGESSERVVTVDSMEPLSALPTLEYVAIGRIRSRDRSLAGFLELPELKALELDKNARFPDSDIDSLRSKGIVVSLF
ncbi:MAG: hypothetical protein OEM85_16455 [Gammaproteobacteria bacterium]|nr:hypothetical protein [Gammaproteobacteria bacterium]